MSSSKIKNSIFWKAAALLTAAIVCLVPVLASCGGGGGEIVLTDDSGDETDDVSGGVFSFKIASGASVAPNDNLATFIAAAGQPVSYEESNSCAYIGLDKVYVYSGYTIYTYPVNGVDYLLQLKFTDDSVSTPEGISIGCTEEEVVSTYGRGFKKIGDSIVYYRGATSLQFTLKSGVVNAVSYSAVE